MGGELDSKEGEIVTVEISDGDRTKVVHTNRLHIRIQPAVNSQPGIVSNPVTPANSSAQSWEPPGVDHFEEPTPQAGRRYPTRNRHAPVRFGYMSSGREGGECSAS